MPDLFLTEDEMLELTECKRDADRLRVLDLNRIPYTVTSKGKPKVARSWFENMYGPGNAGGFDEEPNLGALEMLRR